MPIIYGVVARGNSVLAEFTPNTGNFAGVSRRILEKIPQTDCKMTYTYDNYNFHYEVDDSLTYLCMCEKDFSVRKAFGFLDDIKNRFKATYGDRGKVVPAGSMNSEFSRVLAKQMDYFSNDPGADKISKVRADVAEVQKVMTENIERVLDRGERIELLVDKTEHLQTTALGFKKSSTQLKNKMWWLNAKLIAIGVAILLVLILIIILGICGITFSRCT
ncbi:vesicle-associated membrane protein [Pelomyxa schiedti]|nr:vesicle-associated membrane protein [Pelomyxa schiedti]